MTKLCKIMSKICLKSAKKCKIFKKWYGGKIWAKMVGGQHFGKMIRVSSEVVGGSTKVVEGVKMVQKNGNGVKFL